MKVRMVADISGAIFGRWNVRRGEEFELPPEQARDLIAQGYAEEVKPKRKAAKK